jgi:hypothetical protein
MATSNTEADDLHDDFMTDVAERAPYANGATHACGPEWSR